MATLRAVIFVGSAIGIPLTSSITTAQPTGPTQPVTIEYADKIVFNDETRTVELVGSVRALQGVTRINADKATLYQDANRVVLIGNVRVSQPGTTLHAPRAEYDGSTRIATATNGITINDGDATIRASSGTYDMYSRRATFAGGVTMTDPKGQIRSSTAVYYSNERRAEFHGGVSAQTDSGSISAREISYWRDTEETFAQGDVVVIPKKRDARLTGQTLRHIPKVGYTVVTGSPRLVDIDTATDGTHDTTIISAARLEAYRTDAHSEYVATDSVRIRRGNLEARAARANYIPDDEVLGLGSGIAHAQALAPPKADTTKPAAIAPDSNAIAGRPPDSVATDDANASSRPDPARFESGVWPIVWYDESQLSGDTITVRLSNKKLRTIDVLGDALAASEKEQEERYDQLAGNHLLFIVDGDTIRQVRSEGLASSVMFIEDAGKPSGVERHSADLFIVDFAGGEAESVSSYGPRTRIEGEHYPENMVDGNESTFRLDSFRWIPRDASIARLKATLPKEPSIPPVRNAPEGD